MGIRRGWRAETPTRGAPSPAPLQSCASGSPSAWIPCEAKVSPSPGSSLTPTYHFLLHPGVSTWLWGPWLLHTPLSTCLSLSTSFLSFWVCLPVSVNLSVYECLPISFSFLFSMSACTSFISLCPSDFSLPPYWVFSSLHLPSSPFFRSTRHPSVTLSFCPHGFCLCLSCYLYGSLPTSPASLCPTAVFLSPLLCAHCLWADPPLSPIFPHPSLIWPLCHVLSFSLAFDQDLNPICLTLAPLSA